MGRDTGFMEIGRQMAARRSVDERVKDWFQVYKEPSDSLVQGQGERCMDCGIPFCHTGCPLGNIIPDWNDLVYRNRWKEAIKVLHKTNNFPEFTGWVCPAPCEAACVLGINDDPVTIKQIELRTIDHAFQEGWIKAEPPKVRTNKKVAIVGSGPSGLACAAQLNRAGHWVTVFERADRIGGLLTYGIPDFKLEKWVVKRRLDLMEEEGVLFKTNANVGFNVPIDELRQEFDALVLAGGATQPRDLSIPGRDLAGIHFAMEFLPQQNRRIAGDQQSVDSLISAEGKRVIILGGGDTGSDCHGTALRQGALSVASWELLPKPPTQRNSSMPWPYWPTILRTSSSHEEGGSREWSVSTKRFIGSNGSLQRLEVVRVEFGQPDANGRRPMKEVAGSEFEVETELVLLAMGFLGPERAGMLEKLEVKLDERGNVLSDNNYMSSVEGVFAAGDIRRGQSLVVWAIAEGRQAARGVDQYLMGSTDLPS
ncbi:MAG: glutamate synthase subunit beta [Acidobacteriia bacterium]|jgi:glutamate synthase (NADPH/NADH) small chain|nr:glutamate synthase subunit beta [Terriglobia bacterium]